ncbi:MAG: hypothetical protein JRF63_07345 [Deltaproteobacteria bacterium]|nr:hypothetical protein [Deltaproteobacteria bacterium]
MEPTRDQRLAIHLLVIGSAILSALPAAATESESPSVIAEVNAALSKGGDVLRGTIDLTITNDSGVPVDAIPLWLYPNRFADPEAQADDRTVNWIYPGLSRKGSMQISDPHWNGSPLGDDAVTLEPMPEGGLPAEAADVVARVRLPMRLRAGERGELSLQFEVQVPRRRGRFGRYGGVVSLGGGWFPRPMSDLSGRDPARPPQHIGADVRVALVANRGAVVADQVFRPSEHARTIEVLDLIGEDVPLVVLDRMDVHRRELGWGTAVYVSQELRRDDPDWEDTRGRDEKGLPRALPRVGSVDVHGRALDIVEITTSILRREAPDCPLPERLVMVEIPAMDRLVQAGPGMLLVSDRLWRLIPFDALLAFHDQVLARELGAELAHRASSLRETAEHRHLAAEVVGAVVGQLYIDEVVGGGKSVQDLIGIAGFLPRVDNLLYAPQVPFREAYSPSVEGEDPLRDEPWRFMNQLPRGRRLAAKLEDLVGQDQLRVMAIDLMVGRSNLAGAVAQSLGQSGARRFFDQWLGEYPSVNYRLGAIEDERLEDGRVRHRVQILRDGARVVEPVTVLIVDDDDESGKVTWDGEGSEGWVEWISNAPVDEVRIDPEHRLVEDPALTGDHPLADNIDPLPWRPPMLTRFVIWGDALTLEPHIDLSFAMRRKYDITNSYHLSGSYTPRGYGGLFAYLRHFGTKRTLNSRIWYAGPTLSVFRHHEIEQLSSDIPVENNYAATMGTFGLLLGRDNRQYFWDPRSGFSFDVAASYSTGRADDGRTVHTGAAGTRLFGLVSPGIGHTFALYGGATCVVGEPVAADLASFSTRNILRGFALDETYGRVGMYAVTEYRHRLIDLSSIYFLTFARFDRLQGALFVAGGTMSRPTGYDGLFNYKGGRVFTEVGYGLRLHVLSLGVAQYLIALDVAVPITPFDRSFEVEGYDEPFGRPPFKLVFGITQTY